MKTILNIWIILLVLSCSACQDFLDIKPDKQRAIPEDKLENLQLLLDNTGVMNNNYPSSGELASDNSYLIPQNWNASSVTDRNIYIWEREVFNDFDRNDWTLPYEAVFFANLALEGAAKVPVPAGRQRELDHVRGSALFFRAHAFYCLLQIFAKPYDPATAAQDLGIALRLNANINERSVRASVANCYVQILGDLVESLTLLPETAAYKTRPSIAAAQALLARIHLSMRQYEQALKYANAALSQHNELMDYNDLNTIQRYPFVRFNEEVIFHYWIAYRASIAYPRCRVDTLLYQSYAEGDLRKSAFFIEHAPDVIEFRGSYDGTLLFFGGLATDELYLIRAECRARLNDLEGAMEDLNQLMEQRWEAGSFEPFQAANAQAALEMILTERRKELLFRGLRWTDLRRLNQEPAHAKTLIRVLEDETYTLEPGSRNYVFPIPERAIQASDMVQNE